MKHIIRQTLGAFLLTGAALLSTDTSAQRVEATTTTTTTEGTLSEFGTEGVSIQTAQGVQPVRYISNTTTNYVDEQGNPVPYASLKSGLPITVYYTKVGDTLVATKIMVRKAAPAPVVVLDPSVVIIKSSGTFSEFGPERIIIRTKTSPDPLSYTYSKTTTYVDEQGNPVSLKMVKAGTPVSVSYTQVGDTFLASKVIVLKSADVSAPVIQEKTTTIEVTK